MRRTKIAALTAVAMTAVTTLAGGFARPHAPHGREVFKIVGTIPGPVHARVTAKGAFAAHGYFLRKKASLIFPAGHIGVRRNLLSTSVEPPNLATCRFTEQQHGTFQVSHATGTYRGLRDSGQFWTHVAGRLKRTGHDQCGSKIVHYHSVTYEIGDIP